MGAQDVPAPQLSIVIPAMNEERRLPRTLQRVVEYMRERPETWEVIVVDDGSRDRTADIVEELSRELDEPRLTVLRLARNQGKGGAQREGVAHSRGERVLLMDADLATPIEELEHHAPSVASSRLARQRGKPLDSLLRRRGDLRHAVRLQALPWRSGT